MAKNQKKYDCRVTKILVGGQKAVEKRDWFRDALRILETPSNSTVKREPELIWKRAAGKTSHVPFYRSDSK